MGSFAKIFAPGVVLDDSTLARITADLKPKARKIVNKHGLIIMSDAAQRAPVDTSALRNSILAESKMTGDMTFTVSDGVEYGIFQEFGTSKMGAQPFMIPAINADTEDFKKDIAELFV